MKAFVKNNVTTLFDHRRSEILHFIESIRENIILNFGEEQFCEETAERYEFEFPHIDPEEKYIDSERINVKKSHIPPFVEDQRRPYSNQEVVVYFLPYQGEIDLIKWKPTKYTSSAGSEVTIDQMQPRLRFEIVNYDNTRKNREGI